MTTKEVLKLAQLLIADEDQWCRYELAIHADGTPCVPGDTKAVRFCAAGALERVSPGNAKAYNLLEETAKAMYMRCLIAVNNELGHSAVMNVFGAALLEA